MDKKNEGPGASDSQNDEVGAVESSKDEIQEGLIDELGLDPEEQSELLEKLTERELEHQKRFSGAIKQKISYREKYEAATKSEGSGKSHNSSNTDVPDFEDKVAKTVKQILEEKELQSLDLPDSLKSEVANIAKLKGISINEAAKDPYIDFQVKEHQAKERITKATPKRGGTTKFVKFDPSSPPDPSDYELHTEEGRKAWQEAKKKYRDAFGS